MKAARCVNQTRRKIHQPNINVIQVVSLLKLTKVFLVLIAAFFKIVMYLIAISHCFSVKVNLELWHLCGFSLLTSPFNIPV